MGPLEVLKFTFFMAPGFNVWLFMLSPFTLILPSFDIVYYYASSISGILSETSSEIMVNFTI